MPRKGGEKDEETVLDINFIWLWLIMFSLLISHTIFSDWPQYSLEDVIVDNNVQQTEAVEVAIESQGQDGG